MDRLAVTKKITWFSGWARHSAITAFNLYTMLKIGPDGRLQRIEYRGKYLRVSRSGGIALRAQTKAAGINFTANSADGLRASTRVAKGTQVAFQNGRFVLRGRYGEGPTKLNLSKSGVSVSTKTEIGTVNWFKPRYSSAKIGGIHVRGKNAIYLHLLVGVLSLLAYIALAVVQATVVILQALYWLTLQGGLQVQRLWATRHQATIEATEARWLSELSIKDADWLKTGIEWILLDLGQGNLGLPRPRRRIHRVRNWRYTWPTAVYHNRSISS